MSNKAAWLTAVNTPFKVDKASMPSPDPHEIVIRNFAVAFNPVDQAMQATGLFVEKYPTVLGIDGAGKVTAVGSNVTRLKVGDRVLAMFDAFGVKKTTNSAYQTYAATSEKNAVKIPDGVSYAQATVLPLGFATAVDALYADGTLELPLPQLNPKPSGKVILVWGGSSSVGACGIQLAKASGFEVIATAGAKNKEFCESLGASQVFDHKREDVVEDIVASLHGKEFAGAFSAIMDKSVLMKCASIAKQLGGPQLVATVMPPSFPLLDALPKDITWGLCQGQNIFNYTSGQNIWTEWLPAALESGALKCKPDPFIVGKGLEEIQKGTDQVKKGVSGQKVVVELP